MPPRQIVIGDVHGHYNSLQRLLDAIAPSQDDQVYFLGDLIDRGPDSAKVVEFLIKSGYPCVRGNHEEMFLEILHQPEDEGDDSLYTWLYNGGQATLNSYGNAVPHRHVEWLNHLPPYLDLGDYWLVHAGVDPELPLEEQDFKQFCWIREEFHAMTKPYFPDKTIIIGHTITFTFPEVEPGKIVQGAGWLDIDTGAYHPHSHWLTGIDLTHHQVYQYNHDLNQLRQLSLEEATVQIDPSSLLERRLSKVR